MKRFMPLAMAIAIGTSAPLAQSHPVVAAVLTWDLTFWDSSGAVAGSGEFSYDDAVLAFVQTNLANPPDGFTVQNALTQFAATVLGKEWELRDRPGVTWWHPDAATSLGQQRVSRSSVAIADSWFFGDPFFGTRQLLIDIRPLASSTTWGGSWFELVLNSTTAPTTGGGTWAATPRSQAAVPEPTTILGTVLFGLGGWCSKTVIAQRSKQR